MSYLVILTGKCGNKYLNGYYNNSQNFAQNFIWHIKTTIILLQKQHCLHNCCLSKYRNYY